MRLEEEKRRNLINSIVIPRPDGVPGYYQHGGNCWIWADEKHHNVNVLTQLINECNCRNGYAQSLINRFHATCHVGAGVSEHQYNCGYQIFIYERDRIG